MDGRALPDVVFSGGAALVFPSIDRAHLFSVELQAHTDAAAVLADEHDAGLFQRF